MGILLTTHMGFLFTITLGILFTIALGIQFTISSSRGTVRCLLLHPQRNCQRANQKDCQSVY